MPFVIFAHILLTDKYGIYPQDKKTIPTGLICTFRSALERTNRKKGMNENLRLKFTSVKWMEGRHNNI